MQIMSAARSSRVSLGLGLVSDRTDSASWEFCYQNCSCLTSASAQLERSHLTDSRCGQRTPRRRIAIGSRKRSRVVTDPTGSRGVADQSADEARLSRQCAQSRAELSLKSQIGNPRHRPLSLLRPERSGVQPVGPLRWQPRPLLEAISCFRRSQGRFLPDCGPRRHRPRVQPSSPAGRLKANRPGFLFSGIRHGDAGGAFAARIAPWPRAALSFFQTLSDPFP
ncbi:MAG: hypothetical protein JWQ13_89 [Ramlibacter sp.]|nr:hypothetical protein [Ramlibacter sp.]